MVDKERSRPLSPFATNGRGSEGAGGRTTKGLVERSGLAPLAFLQSQRRGSITDPSLHAATASPNSIPRSSFSAPRDLPLKLSDDSPILPSPPSPAHDLPASPSPDHNHMNDPKRPPFPPHPPAPHEHPHSVAPSATINSPRAPARGTASPSLPHGTKRKYSHDRGMAAPVNEDIDPQLIGPGVPSSIADHEGPAPKRRSSVMDAQRMDQFDRRHSLDARMAHGTPGWWVGDRRDAGSTVFPSSTVTYSTPSFSADSPHGRPPGSTTNAAWHTTQQPEASSNQSEAGPSTAERSFDPSVNPLAMMPSILLDADRRMSIPSNLSSNPPINASATRPLRSRSRPPSASGNHSRDKERSTDEPGSSAVAANAEPPNSAPASSSQNSQPPGRDPGATPYSRSPELRVSHKLAERKRRKEMKDLFDELRDQLPADRGMKASKWEILSKAVDFIIQLKHSQQDMSREVEMLRHELETIRQGMSFAPGGPHAILYPPPPGGPGHYPPSGPAIPPHPIHPSAAPPSSISRPSSAQKIYSSNGGSTAAAAQNDSAPTSVAAQAESKANAPHT
ncbi:hypothetical protein DENSPDRAFT_831188 [Dentipellis sp. KUC8613]|nr:hypothetical protein DENSPDRAFT_831188 [Dentipellis sp. KUC8613]